MTENEIEVVRIPEERVKVLIGKEGSTKKMLEKRCNVKLRVVSDGEVEISGDPTDVFFSLDVVKAIGRGFEPRIALRLMKDDYVLYIVHLRETVNTDKAMKRVKGRIIGERGSIKTQIEDSTDAKICLYGSTIAIIARIDAVEYTKEAVDMLLRGVRHSSVLSYLAKSKREIMQQRLMGS